MIKRFTLLTSAICFICFSFKAPSGFYPPPDLGISLQKEIGHSIKEGLKWLYLQQEENGSWQHHPAITSLVLSSFLRAHPNISYQDSNITAGFNFLKKCIKPDGSIFLDDMPNYNTSICLTAFKDAHNPEFNDIINNAEIYLMRLQIDEDEGYSTDSLYYGGVGYGGDERPDLSNLQWAVEALQNREEFMMEKTLTNEQKQKEQQKKLFYDKALIFLSKCQNLKSINPEDYSGNDGGFMYEPGSSKAGGTTSYGSMTYAGLKSMIYARVNKNDKRVKAAYNWIKQNYVIDTTPKMGNQGLFYYYQTMAKALHAYGEDIITDANGIDHNWREEFANQLLKIQNEEGWWQNENGRWWENNRVLVTAYCILSLEEIMK